MVILMIDVGAMKNDPKEVREEDMDRVEAEGTTRGPHREKSTNEMIGQRTVTSELWHSLHDCLLALPFSVRASFCSPLCPHHQSIANIAVLVLLLLLIVSGASLAYAAAITMSYDIIVRRSLTPRDYDQPYPSREPAAPRRPPHAPAKVDPNPVLGVFGLSIRTRERDLDDEFARYGDVEKVVIVYDQRVSTSQTE